MPAGLRRYWASRKRDKGVKSMSRRRRSGRRYGGRRLARGASRGGNRILNFFGIGKNSVSASRLIASVSLVSAPFIPMRVQSDGGASAWDYLNPFQKRVSIIGTTPVPYSTRLIAAADCGTRAFFNHRLDMSIASTPYAGLNGLGVGTGIGIAIAGRFVNPLLTRMPVKG